MGGQVSFAAHIGGFLAGMVLILFMRRPGVLLLDRTDNVVIPDPIDPSPGASAAVETAEEVQMPASVPSAGKRKTVRWGRGGEGG